MPFILFTNMSGNPAIDLVFLISQLHNKSRFMANICIIFIGGIYYSKQIKYRLI